MLKSELSSSTRAALKVRALNDCSPRRNLYLSLSLCVCLLVRCVCVVALLTHTHSRPSVYSGNAGNLLISSAPFYLLVRRKIKQLLKPSLECANLVHAELEKICASAIPPNVDFFPNLRHALTSKISEFLVSHMNSSLAFITSLIDIQMSYINTNHSDFLSGNEAMKIAMRRENLATSVDAPKSGSRSAAKHHHRDSNAHLDEKENIAARNSERFEQQQSPAAATKHTSFLRNFNASLSLRNPESDKAEQVDHAAGKMGASGSRFEEDEFPNVADGSNSYAPASSSLAVTPHGRDAKHQGAGLSTPQSHSSNTISLPAPPHQIYANPNDITMNEKIEISVTRELLNSYSKIVLRQFQDLVPKTVHHFQVNSVSENLQQHLIESLYKPDNMETLMEMRSDVSEFRDRNLRDVDMCKQALNILDQVPGEIWRIRQQQQQH